MPVGLWQNCECEVSGNRPARKDKMKTKVGVTGARGRLGRFLCSHFENYIPLECDVTQPTQIENCLRDVKPDVVLHLAAKSDVDWCERLENRATVSQVNLRGTYNVCRAVGDVKVILLSSDHVFNGQRGRYTEKDRPSPVNHYGFSKYSAEALQSAFSNLKVIRTSYLFNAERLAPHGSGWYPDFISRSFLYIPHFVDSLNMYIERIQDMPSRLNLSGSETASWYDFMRYLSIKAGGIKVYRRSYELDFSGRMAPRPKKAGLNVSLSKKLGFPQYSYKDGIIHMLQDIQ